MDELKRLKTLRERIDRDIEERDALAVELWNESPRRFTQAEITSASGLSPARVWRKANPDGARAQMQRQRAKYAEMKQSQA